MDYSNPGFPVLHHLPEFAHIHVHWVGDAFYHLVLCHSLLLLPSIFLSIRIFSYELAFHIRLPNYWSFRISPFNEYSGLIFFRIDWFDLLAVQGILKHLLQHHGWKASILWPFFMVQLSHPHDYQKNHGFNYMDFYLQSSLCFLIHCVGFPWLFFQGARVFQFRGCSHHLQLFWSPRK